MYHGTNDNIKSFDQLTYKRFIKDRTIIICTGKTLKNSEISKTYNWLSSSALAIVSGILKQSQSIQLANMNYAYLNCIIGCCTL